MSMNNLQQTRLNRQEIIYYPLKGMYDPVKFAEWLESAFKGSAFKSYAQLGEAAGLSRSAVSAFAKAKPQTANNKASQPKAENVISLAKALGKDIDEALLAAGHAPSNQKDVIRPEVKILFHGAENWSDRKWNAVTEAIKKDLDFIDTVMPDED